MEEEKIKIKLCTRKDFDVSYFCGSGSGGQAKNKVHSGCQIIHRESGAQAKSSDTRSLEQNKKSAFQKLIKTAKMKFWLAKKLYEIRQGETLEQTIEQETKPENLKFEVKNEDGKWTEVSVDYFNTEKAKYEQRN